MKGIRTQKGLIKNLVHQKLNFPTFQDIPKKIAGRYTLYHAESYNYYHEYAVPHDVHHYHDEKVIYILKNVSVWPNNSVVAIDRNTFIRDSAYSTHRLKKFIEKDQVKSKPVIHEDMPCVAIDGGEWNNYYHWHIDILPRLFGLYHPEIRRLETVKLYLSNKISDEYLRIVEKLVPANVEVELYHEPLRISAKTYIHLPYLTSEWDGHLPEDYLDFYRRSIFSMFDIKPDKSKQEKNIYISRKYAHVRRIINEDALLSVIRDYGFEIYRLEYLTFRQQVELFAQAGTVLAQHGAGLTNILYSHNIKIIEIFSSNYPGVNHYRLLASSLNHQYANMFADHDYRPDILQVPWKTKFKDEVIDKDIEIDVGRVEEKIRQVMCQEKWKYIG